MSIEDYALELGVDVSLVISKVRELGFKYNNASDILDDEAIIMLDNEMGDLSEKENNLTDELADKFEMEDRAEAAALAHNIGLDTGARVKEKIKKKDSAKQAKDEELSLKKKNIYKNKTKLKSNKEESSSNVVLYKEGMSVNDLAQGIGVSASDVVKKLIGMGLMISSNQAISFDDASIVVLEYNKELTREETTDITNFEEYVINDSEEELEPRPAVVTIMGHVDHGKTTLLDYIRNSHVASGEAGGITQAIGAYQVNRDGKKITFIDTPGHAAFTEMRARGASVTDIVIIIVAADDGVMPQTREAIDHAKAANVPIIVAVNKIDKPNTNIEKIMSELSELGLTPEEWGGDTIYCKISAKTGEGVDLLLDNINALSEVLELKANPNRYATGSVIEAKLDKNKGPVVTLLIQNGTLRLGDPIVVGTNHGKVRTLRDDTGREIISAEPSKPVEVTGLEDVPVAGDKFMAFESEKEARSVAIKRKEIENNGDRIIGLNSKGKNFLYLIQVYFRLKRHLKKNKYDVIHINSGVVFFNAVAAKVAHRYGNCKIIVHSHSAYVYKGVKEKVAQYARQIIKKNADNFFACSEVSARTMFPKDIVEKKEYILITNAINSNLYKYDESLREKIRKELKIEDDCLLIGNVSRLSRIKNHGLLIELVQGLVAKGINVKMIFLGDGELKNELISRINEAGLKDRIYLLGMKDDAYKYYNAMDCFALPSFSEGFGIVAIEAQTNGLNCILSDTIPKEVAVTDLVKFVDINNKNEWMDSIIDSKNKKIERKNCYQMIERTNFNIKNAAKELEKLYDSIK